MAQVNLQSTDRDHPSPSLPRCTFPFASCSFAYPPRFQTICPLFWIPSGLLASFRDFLLGPFCLNALSLSFSFKKTSLTSYSRRRRCPSSSTSLSFLRFLLLASFVLDYLLSTCVIKAPKVEFSSSRRNFYSITELLSTFEFVSHSPVFSAVNGDAYYYYIMFCAIVIILIIVIIFVFVVMISRHFPVLIFCLLCRRSNSFCLFLLVLPLPLPFVCYPTRSSPEINFDYQRLRCPPVVPALICRRAPSSLKYAQPCARRVYKKWVPDLVQWGKGTLFLRRGRTNLVTPCIATFGASGTDCA